MAEAAYVLFVKQRPAVVSAISDTSNTPLEWTGHPVIASHVELTLPAAQGQR